MCSICILTGNAYLLGIVDFPSEGRFPFKRNLWGHLVLFFSMWLKLRRTKTWSKAINQYKRHNYRQIQFTTNEHKKLRKGNTIPIKDRGYSERVSSSCSNWGTLRVAHCLNLENSRNWVGVVVVVWQLDLQLPLQSVHTIANVGSSNPAHNMEYSI